MQRSPFDHSIYYLRRKYEGCAGGSHWTFSLHDGNGTLLLEARFPEIPKEVIIFAPGGIETPLLYLKAWRWFWWNGRYDVVESDTKAVLGTLRRTGGIEGPDRRCIGAIRNAMPLRKSFVQLFCVGILNSIFGVGSDSSALSVDNFHVEANGSRIGTLRRVRLPFPAEEEVVKSTSQGWLRRWIGRFRSTIRTSLNSSGWQLDFSDDQQNRIPPKVRLAAALFRIQIEERYN